MPDADDLVLALEPVARLLQTLGVRFYIGGSVASSFHGAVRSTMDVDIVCELTEGDETSERQWDDESRLMALLGDTADLVYLRQAAESVGVADLLQRLFGGDLSSSGECG